MNTNNQRLRELARQYINNDEQDDVFDDDDADDFLFCKSVKNPRRKEWDE